MRHCSLLCLVLTLSACATRTPRVLHYDLSTLELSQNAANHTGPSLAIERFRAAAGLGSDQVFIRGTDYRLDHYYYHRWRAPSSELVTEFFVDAFAASGAFCRVAPDRYTSSADLLVTGRIKKLEGVRRSDGSSARVSIDLIARKGQTRELVFYENFRREVPVTERSVQGLVSAFQKGLRSIAKEAAPQIARAAPSGASCGSSAMRHEFLRGAGSSAACAHSLDSGSDDSALGSGVVEPASAPPVSSSPSPLAPSVSSPLPEPTRRS